MKAQERESMDKDLTKRVKYAASIADRYMEEKRLLSCKKYKR